MSQRSVVFSKEGKSPKRKSSESTSFVIIVVFESCCCCVKVVQLLVIFVNFVIAVHNEIPFKQLNRKKIWDGLMRGGELSYSLFPTLKTTPTCQHFFQTDSPTPTTPPSSTLCSPTEFVESQDGDLYFSEGSSTALKYAGIQYSFFFFPFFQNSDFNQNKQTQQTNKQTNKKTAGTVTQGTEMVVKKKIKNAFCVVRPPGYFILH